MASPDGNHLTAFAGQQNAGKSTLFNALTGASQHVANYPGVTVDKQYGRYTHQGRRVTVVDLPGTYSLTSFSLEERVARDFLLNEKPDVIVNVMDASHLKRNLFLTFQLVEMGFPVVVALNMMDVAESQGLSINRKLLSERLCMPVIATVGRKGEGRDALKTAIARSAQGKETQTPLTLNYGALEPLVAELQGQLADHAVINEQFSARWFAVKLLEEDRAAIERLDEILPGEAEDILVTARQMRERFEAEQDISPNDHIMAVRNHLAGDIVATCVLDTRQGKASLSERIDRFLLHPWLAPGFLLGIVFLIYQLSIVQGYELTKITWPILAGFRNLMADWLPDAGFLHDPYVRAMGLWMVDSANTLLNYVPIFLILFALIAILEDSGYMARVAFILDRILHRFGLHGQSTLPYILSGVFAGGCAVPGVMSTKGIPDHRARMATILTAPYMNCLAKVPLYTLLINIFFVEHKGLMLFYISTMTIFFALLVAKLLTRTVLVKHETAPFVMELPHYHLPTFRGVIGRSLDRTWTYIKKVGTVVVAISVVVFVLLQFPGLSQEQEIHYQTRGEEAIATFYKKMEGSPLLVQVQEQGQLVELVNLYTLYKAKKLNAKGAKASRAVDTAFKTDYPDLYPFLKPSRDKKAYKALSKLVKARKKLRREMKEERIVNSFLGKIGRAMEPVTGWADFDWKINVALLSSFAARESSVATLGVLFQQEEGENRTLESRMGEQGRLAGYTTLTALAMIIFFALYPPCLATTIMVKIQTHSYSWMLFSIVFPTLLGLAVAGAVFQTGRLLGLDGVDMMTLFYFSTLALLLVVGLYRPPAFFRRKEEPIT